MTITKRINDIKIHGIFLSFDRQITIDLILIIVNYYPAISLYRSILLLLNSKLLLLIYFTPVVIILL